MDLLTTLPGLDQPSPLAAPVVAPKRLWALLFSFPLLLAVVGLCLEPLPDVAAGLWRILGAPSLLLTDYLLIGGPGATLVNSGVCGFIALGLVWLCQVQLNGPFIAAIFTMIGFSFFGKNFYNIWPIFGGVLLHALLARTPFRNMLLIALFGTTLSPIVSYLSFGAGLPLARALPTGIGAGLLVGFVLPPLASHMLRFHDGFNIYNVGFTGGIITSFCVAILRGLNFEIAPVSLLTNEYDYELKIAALVFFAALSAMGILLSLPHLTQLKEGLLRIYRSPGKLISDFTQIGGYGPSVVNMGCMGLCATAFVMLLGASFNGPVVGSILTVVGFGAFGKHPFNCIPILTGVALASFVKIWESSTTTVVIAGLFGTTLAPITGHFGWLAGIAAGFFHLSITMNVGMLHGGINLYNNGFAGGFVASFMVPVLDAIRAWRKRA